MEIIGSITKISSSNFRLRAMVAGVQRSEYFATMGSAQSAQLKWSKENDSDAFSISKQANELTLRQAILKYLEETEQQGIKTHKKKLHSVLKNGGVLLDKPLGKMLPRHLADYRNHRLTMDRELQPRKNEAALPPRKAKRISPATINQELSGISAVFKYAVSTWLLDTLLNPTKGVRSKYKDPDIGKRVTPSMLRKLIDAAIKYEQRKRTTIPIKNFILFAIATTARLSAIANAKWDHISTDDKTLEIPASDSKNGQRYSVVLTEPVRRMLEQMPRNDEYIFGGNASSISQAWVRVRAMAEVRCRLHDLRHEGTSFYIENAHHFGLSDREIQMITSHKTPQMLQRYTHLHARKVTDKIDRTSKGELQNFIDDLLTDGDEEAIKLASSITRKRKDFETRRKAEEERNVIELPATEVIKKQLPPSDPDAEPMLA